ncbi:hypothetical protein ACIKTA_05685 [Hansschlegelia beijingensis]
MTLALAGAGRRTRPPGWLTLAVLAPTVLISLPIAYVATRAWQVGLAGVAEELFRARTAELLVNTVTLAGSVTLLSAVIGVAVAA